MLLAAKPGERTWSGSLEALADLQHLDLYTGSSLDVPKMTTTPPATTLSEPSDTELNEHDSPPDTPTMPSPRPLYLIVATSVSPPLGIGLKNSLPWKPIKSDMAFFQSVTRDTRPVPPPDCFIVPSKTINAVIMGRRTYFSIPPKFRPLSDRINIVLTRKQPFLRRLAETISSEISTTHSIAPVVSPLASFFSPEDLDQGRKDNPTHAYTARIKPLRPGDKYSEKEMEDATSILIRSTLLNRDLSSPPKHGDIIVGTSINDITHTLLSIREADPSFGNKDCANLFCIGGAEIYDSILSEPREQMPQIRVLQTQVRKIDGTPFEIDTYFPTELSEENGWRAVDEEEVKTWLNIGYNDGSVKLPQEQKGWALDEKRGVEVRVVGWERK